MIENKGASLLYAAPYSPDLNPIEMMFHCCKMFLKRHETEFNEDHVKAHWNALHNSVSKDTSIKEFRKCKIPYSNLALTKNKLVATMNEATQLLLCLLNE